MVLTPIALQHKISLNFPTLSVFWVVQVFGACRFILMCCNVYSEKLTINMLLNDVILD